MIRPLLIATSATLACMLAAASTHAQVSLSLQSGGPNLTQLQVGQTVTVEVWLDGVQPGWQLDMLTATVLYEESLLSAPTISAASVVPDPLADPFDFLVWEEPGIAEGFFLTMGTEPSEFVTTNGTFFSFDVTVEALGSGSFVFDFVDASVFNPADPFAPVPLAPVAGPPLPFIVVPEPTTLSLVILSVPLLLGLRAIRPGRDR